MRGVRGVPKVKRKKKICDKLIVAMALPKYVKFFFGNCGNVIVENGRKKKFWLPKSKEEFKKKNLTFTIFLQHFHKKLQVISYY